MAWYVLDEVEVPHLSASPFSAHRRGCRMIADGRDDVDEDETSRTALRISMSKLDELQYAFPESDANRFSLGSADGTASQWVPFIYHHGVGRHRRTRQLFPSHPLHSVLERQLNKSFFCRTCLP